MTIRRPLLACVTVFGILVGGSTTGRCDISFGDLNEGFDNFGEDWIKKTWEYICSFLVMPTELPTPALPPALPEPMIGEQPTDIPTGVDEGLAAAEDGKADQQDRATNAEGIVEQATQASAALATQLQALEVLNKGAPVSVAGQIMVTNEIGAVAARSAAMQAQLQASALAMQANEIIAREHAAEVETAQTKAFFQYDKIRNGVTVKAD